MRRRRARGSLPVMLPSFGLQSSGGGEGPGTSAWDLPNLNPASYLPVTPPPASSWGSGLVSPGCDGSGKVLQWLAYRKLSPLMWGPEQSGRVGG